MKRTLRRVGVVLMIARALAPAALVQKAVLTVQAARPGKPINTDLFGDFFEDLNHATDGGLYAVLI